MINTKALIGGFVYGAAKHLYSLLVSRAYRKLSFYHSRYGGIKRYTETSLRMGNRQLKVPDVASFLSMYEEIFAHRIYEIPEDAPRILDLGANIGISVIWFKERYPESRILAIEADPKIFQYLEQNSSGLDGVKLLNIAAWDEDGELTFHSEGADGGHLTSSGESTLGQLAVSVDARDIRSILQENGPFDLIKMDIEGSEARVLPACKGLLQETGYIFCEYHSSAGEEQYLAKLLSFLKDEGFRIHVQPVNVSKQPFIKRSINAGFDMQLNIFAWK